MSARTDWQLPETLPEPGTFVRRPAGDGPHQYGIVGVYGWPDSDGRWQHGTQFPVRWDNGLTTLATRRDVEVNGTGTVQP